MDDFDERLAAADPVAGRPYRAPAHLAQRVLAREARPTRVPRPFAWRVAGAAAASVAVTLGAVAAVSQVAPSFAAVTVDAAVTSPTPAEPGAPGTMFATNLPSASATGTLQLAHPLAGPSVVEVSVLARPAHLARDAERIARALGVHGRAVRSGTSPVSWRVGTPPGPTVDVVSGAVAQWYYSSSSPAIAPATQSAGPVRAATERAALRARATALLARLSIPETLGRATFVDAVMDGSSPADVYREITATFVVTHAGLTTDQRVIVAVDARGRLLYAAGPDVTASRDTPAALEPAAAALSALDASLLRGPHASASAAPAHPATVRASVGLRAFVVAGGTTWWLPVYTFTDRTGRHWQVLALTATEERIAKGARGLDAHGVLAP